MSHVRRLVLLVAALLLVVVAAPAVPATAEVTQLGWPYPPNNLEAYPARNEPPVCDFTVQPGPLRLKNLLSFWFGEPNSFSPDWHIRRPCASAGSSSYHREGRALDFYVDHDEPRAQAIVDWILATDEYGNRHARARRMGIVEIIWKDVIWSSDRASDGFRPCPKCGPHYDHIHFSFTRAGAAKRTSWFTTSSVTTSGRCDGGIVTVRYWTYPSGFGPIQHVHAIVGPQGTFDTQAELRASPWQVWTSNGNRFLAADSPMGAGFANWARIGSCWIEL